MLPWLFIDVNDIYVTYGEVIINSMIYMVVILYLITRISYLCPEYKLGL